ncbi:UPF0280 family protein [Methanococcus voltae]|uniref:ApbE superfamily uncharacterized protein (UPF0280 family) n=2 Tax=Methanococcus voltae TaxID=2188 RepID=A0A8J7UTS8_METVO|nr:UPF0280 family protein [Methanococcus voltae]MBP2172945.1 ApbE superfamily uncharacterized protein (UPF0280 family) [Methanococcus voltae]MBP2201999.1 ApbE superfamily uncharacterized protein (UPF0280 family) [Methanococcus voltae]MCS3922162.1 ApbE superfamily uncharacterized protein (UPF0280 family) [Methanococcus voltae PS]
MESKNLEEFTTKLSIKETNILLKFKNTNANNNKNNNKNNKNDKFLKIAKDTIIKNRLILENYIKRNPIFLTSYEPLNLNQLDNSFLKSKNEEKLEIPKVLDYMIKGGQNADVGPMASVAGTFSQLVVEELVNNDCINPMAENGGDIYLKQNGKESDNKDTVVGLYAGKSNISGHLGFKLKKETLKKGYGICTSSGTVGHSVSLGNADAVVVFARNAYIADAAATAIGNYARGTSEEAISKCLERADEIPKIDGVFVAVGENVGIRGKLPKLVSTDKKETYGTTFELI